MIQRNLFCDKSTLKYKYIFTQRKEEIKGKINYHHFNNRKKYF